MSENKKEKEQKAIIALNIMYIVGQYTTFLNSNWKFLKIVVRKLIEFMGEYHPGVQDFACETFLKISIKCGEKFIIINESESVPYILTLVSDIDEFSKDLSPHHLLIFYQALGFIISKELDYNKQTIYLKKMMTSVFSEWKAIFTEANKNPELLLNLIIIRNIELMLKLNERVAFTAGTCYFSFGSYIYENIIKMYSFYSTMINQAYLNKNQFNPIVKIIKIIRKIILRYLQTLIKYNEDQDTVLKCIMPPLTELIDEYKTSLFENNDSDVLLVFTEVIIKSNKTKDEQINTIWNFLCLHTIEMIKSDFQNFPDHLFNLFNLIKAFVINNFDALFHNQDSNFNQEVLKIFIWAFKHSQPTISETGLETLIILLNNINTVKLSNGLNVANLFYKSYFFYLIEEIFLILTDNYQISGFKLLLEIIQILLNVVDGNIIQENLFQDGHSNKNIVINKINQIIGKSNNNLNTFQIETFVLELFYNCNNKDTFKVIIRDFLVNLKSFTYLKESFTEGKIELNASKSIEQTKDRINL